MSNIWADDLLGRQKDARLVIEYLTSRAVDPFEKPDGGSFVLNINAEWGLGKTFFLDRLARQLLSEGYVVATVNAWRNDGGGQPLTAVMAAIDHALRPHYAEKTATNVIWQSAKIAGGKAAGALAVGTVKVLIKKIVGDGLEQAIEIIQDASDANFLDSLSSDEASDMSENFADKISTVLDGRISSEISSYQAKINSIDEFKKRLGLLIRSIKESGRHKIPLFILIDELDRCRPTYAVEMLEQIKHLFDTPSVAFIIATDTDQLGHAVRSIYGQSFAADRYLARFFDRSFALSTPNNSMLSAYLFEKYKIEDSKINSYNIPPYLFFERAADYYSLTTRDIFSCFDILRSFIDTWNYPVSIELAYLLPLIMTYHLKLTEEFNALSSNLALPINEKRSSLWTIPIQGRNGKTHIRVTTVLQEMHSLMQMALPDITQDNSDTSPSRRIVISVFNREFRILHNHSWTGAVGPSSVMKSYPDRIRGLGRFEVPPIAEP